MKTLKKTYGYLTTLTALLAMLALMSCDDDDEPSMHDLLIGEWELDEFNDVRVTNVVLKIELEADGDYKERWTDEYGTDVETGEWTLVGQEVEIEYDDGDETELEIKELTNELLLVEDEDGDEWLFERD